LATRDTLKSVVLVNVTAQTAPAAAETIRGIAANGLACAAIVVAGDPIALDADACFAAAGAIPLSIVSGAELLAAVRKGLGETGAAGVFTISAGIHVPHAFDVRLARIAMQDPSVGTVSPFCDLSGIHRLRSEPAREDAQPAGLARLDRLAFLMGQRTYFEVPEGLAECCFVPATAIERLAASDAGPGAWMAKLSAAGLLHVLSDSVYVGKLPGAALAARLDRPRIEPPHLDRSRRSILEAEQAGVDFNAAPGLDARPVQLHVLHDLGGGTAKWLRDFGRADAGRINMVLKALTHGQAMGTGLALYTDVMDEVPLRVWEFSAEIQATVTTHLEYRRVLDEIVETYCVDALLVSSLIGHSLDVLATGLPTVVVTHDYFPYCPAINIHFGGVCRECDGKRIDECYRKNPHYNPFVTFLPAERVQVRERFMELARRPNVTLATPSRSVADNLLRLNALFKEVAFETIPHGYGDPLTRVEATGPASQGRLRILVLGQLSVLKGMELLRGALGALTKFADVWLLGPREVGEAFQFDAAVHVISDYEVADLPSHVANINPDVALLTSLAPETFNYALTELFMLGVPVAATRVGSFPERIRHRENGYLYEPDVPSLVRMMGEIHADRETLARIRGGLAGWQPRSAAEMVADYHRIIPVTERPFARYPLGRPASDAADRAAPASQAYIAQATTLSSMWKEVKRLHTQLSVVMKARVDEHAIYQGNCRQLADSEEANLKKDAAIGEQEMQIQALRGHLEMKTDQVAELRSSTSWRVTGPLRVAGRLIRAVKSAARQTKLLLGDPATIAEDLGTLTKAFRSGGVSGARRALRELSQDKGRERAWEEYRRDFRRNVRPRIVERIAEMSTRPLISVIVPSYNTNEDMLRQMLDSVRAQLYPNWELCVADDASSDPRVGKVLKEYQKHDRRIKVHGGEENRGVSHALNRALEMAQGDFVVLLDHDDLLEEQALFRFAECILEDDPDMLYADEALVDVSGNTIRRYAHRPAFSPEFLRGHPYVVHPVGFRRQLLLDLGAFDESLRISQDYDLILRASERARTIVHIPEVLYLWRIHGGSTGLQKMHEVMQTSRGLLERHLERCGEEATVHDGPAFNLFDVRYPLREGLSVAIIIPTKNHRDVLRDCIESIWATVTGVAYEIVVVDHESDDRDTLDYLASLPSSVRILRYQGPFNFSAINNWAVSQVAGKHSHYLFCNNDIEAITAGWLERMLELGQQKTIGIVGAKLLYPDRVTIQHAGVCVGAFGAAEHYGKRLSSPEQVEPGFSELLVVNHEVAAVTAACLLIRRDAFEEISGFDEAIAVGFGDVDLCLRAGQAGYRVVMCPYAELVHHESYTRGISTRDPHPEDSALFRFKWKKLLEAGDPFYSPALSLTSTSWAIKLPLNCSYEIRRRIVKRDRQSGRATVSFSSTAR
jgi:GT2 family glycosyltransferase/glycosyltransferase involved in cell wall biosynthesis